MKNRSGIYRRRFLKSWLAAFAAGLGVYKQSWANTLNSPLDHNALISFIDLLLPEDETPRALSVGADAFILKKADTDKVYAKALRKGVYWLNFVAKKLNARSFSSLPLVSQIQIISFSENSRITTIPNLFYLMIREDVFRYYYAHPDVLKHFTYARPPQPLGFLDFSEAPTSRNEN